MISVLREYLVNSGTEPKLVQLERLIEKNKYEYHCVVGKNADGRFYMLFADSALHQPDQTIDWTSRRSLFRALLSGTILLSDLEENSTQVL